MLQRKEKICFGIVGIILVTLLVITIIVSISDINNKKQIVNGTVIDKIYYPASGGKHGNREQYIVVIQGDNDIVADYNVTALVYDKLYIGEYITNVNMALKWAI